jgi:hypothetical protein
MRARHRLSKLLLRHDVRYHDTASGWTAAHRAWLATVALAEPAAQATLHDYLGAIEALLIRRDTLERTIDQLVPASPWALQVARLRCLRGIDTLTAVGLCAEIGDFDRFQRAGQLMSYLGLVPSEHSSGQTRQQGAITKSGSCHARRLLVEAAVALPAAAAHRHNPQAPPTRPAASRARDLLERPTTTAPALAPTRRPTRQTQNDHRRRRRPPHDATRSCGNQPAHISLTKRRAPAPAAAPQAEYPRPPTAATTDHPPYQTVPRFTHRARAQAFARL